MIFDVSLVPASLDFDFASFWVRMFHLPLGCMSDIMGSHLGSLVGHVEEVETDVDGIGWGEYLRVRITLDLSKPLAQVRLLKIKGVSTWIAFQYERLPKFCFLCGVIKHGIRGCLGRKGPAIQGVGAQVHFGTWLRASSSGRRQDWNRRGSSGSGARMAVDCPGQSLVTADGSRSLAADRRFEGQFSGGETETVLNRPKQVVNAPRLKAPLAALHGNLALHVSSCPDLVDVPITDAATNLTLLLGGPLQPHLPILMYLL